MVMRQWDRMHTADRAWAEKPTLCKGRPKPPDMTWKPRPHTASAVYSCCFPPSEVCLCFLTHWLCFCYSPIPFSGSWESVSPRGFLLNRGISSVIKIFPRQPSENISQYAPPCPVKTSFPPLQNLQPYCMDTLPSICFANPPMPFYVRNVTIS